MRALLWFGDEIDRNSLIESGKYLRDNYGFELCPFYIRDIKRAEMIPYTGNGVILDDTASLTVDQWEEFQSEEIADLQKLLRAHGVSETLSVGIGLVPDVVSETMKEKDILLFGKGEVLTDNQITILKKLFKPAILVGKKPITFDRIMVANDDGTRINRSCFTFMNMFSQVENFTSVTINLEIEDNHLIRYLKSRGKTVETLFIPEKTEKDFKKDYPEDFSLIITGKLKRSYFLEKIIKKRGISLIENFEISTFIG